MTSTSAHTPALAAIDLAEAPIAARPSGIILSAAAIAWGSLALAAATGATCFALGRMSVLAGGLL